jgi:primosomal protein N' (replication factor Y)
MTAEFQAGHRSMYSRRLTEELVSVAGRGEKSVLFLNRRGFASFLLCRECGFVPECTQCSVSLTYHEDVGELHCHHCGGRHAVPPTCPRCGSAYLRRFGAGTQRAESELAALLPGVPVVRMDADTTAGKGGHERALTLFESHSCAVLLGTQMIAKGLDYPDVTLVGVLNADTSMHVPDFRAAERTFQLLEQVAGRAGRGPLGGRVVIQTYWPDHPAVVAVATRDATALYERERADRMLLGYPPYGRLVNIGITGKDAEAVRATAERTVVELRRQCPPEWEILGPAPAPIARIKGRWRWHAVVKAPDRASLSAPVRAALDTIAQVDGVSVVADVDPVGML